MLEHRLREFFASAPVAVTEMTAAPTSAFVPCPCSMFSASASAQASIAEIYRLAREMTAAQLQPPRPVRPWPPAFSAN